MEILNDSHDINVKQAPMLPAARLLMEAFGLMTKPIPATGPKGHLLKGDVLQYIEANKVPKLQLHSTEKPSPIIKERPERVETKTTEQAVKGNLIHLISHTVS